MKKGLNDAIFIKNVGRASIGIIVEEKKRRINPTDIAASVPVSSDLNRLPMIIPIKINIEVTSRRSKAIGPITGSS